MCYSALQRQEQKEYERLFGTLMRDEPAYLDLFEKRLLYPKRIVIPPGFEKPLIEAGGAFGRTIATLVAEYENQQTEKRRIKLEETEHKIEALQQKLANKFTKTAQEELDRKMRVRQRLLSPPRGSVEGGWRLYPGEFASIIIEKDGQRILTPARYQMFRKSGLDLSPDEYNLYNARRDMLRTRDSWIETFGQQHALFPFVKFFESVGPKDAKMEIAFTPDGHSQMWAPAFYQQYTFTDVGFMRSFSLLTDDPPSEVERAGHDRCPIFLKKSAIADWLHPEDKTLDQLERLLDYREETYFLHALAA